LCAIFDAGIVNGMTQQRKITVLVPEDLLVSAQKETGTGVTETVREGLKNLASRRAQRELLALRGKVKFSLTWEELKEDRR
jgi:hypothetical protein